MKSWKSWIGLALSALFLWMAFRNIDWTDFGRSLAHISLIPLFGAMAVVMVTLMIRGFRWTFLIKPVMPCSPVTLFWSTTIGFAINNVMPARLGELARTYSASRRTGAAFGSVFGTIVVERLYDTFTALFLFASLLAFADFPDIDRIFPVGQGKVAIVLGAGGGGLLAAILLLKFRTEFFLRVASFFLKPLPERWSRKMIVLFRSFIAGLTQSSKPQDILAVLGLSVGIWVISALNVFLAVYSFGVALSPSAVIILLSAIIVSVAIPAAPGYVGVYHYLAQQALVAYVGMDPAKALSIAVVVHASNYIPQTLVGLLRFAYEGMSVKQIQDLKSAP
ncbi:MAG: flippase-like domain-containing protein [Deltaproteobacteria bacterium]|nr:flippase-like domain-containing protein [Deltaproteobacteria bacterium]